MKNIAIIGQGAIGSALAEQLKQKYPNAIINIFSRRFNNIDYFQEQSIVQAAEIAGKLELDMVLVTTGILHGPGIKPEKSIKDLNPDSLQEVYYINTILPALIAKHFLPKFSRRDMTIFAAISARVGSISDNRLGGWYAYRASKAALNMIIKNLAIEFGRSNKNLIITGLHPGTVASNLSAPFQGNVESIFTPEESALNLLKVLQGLSVFDSGKCFAWDGSEIMP